VTLTAACLNNPTSYQWSGCQSTTNACQATAAAPGNATYSLVASNAQGPGATAYVSVNWQQPPTAVPACTLTASTPTPYVGGVVTLTANCTQSPQSWQWSVPSCTSNLPTCQATSSTAGPASYSVGGTNLLGAGPASPPVTVTWTQPPPGGADFCGAYADVVEVTLPWPTPANPNGTVLTRDIGGMRPSTIIVGRLTVPATANVTGTGQVRFVEYVDGQAQRQMTASTNKCDFRGFSPGSASPVDPTSANYPMSWSNDINPIIFFGSSTAVRIQPGQTYYFNLRNVDWASGTSSCQTTTCNGLIQVATP
jgi:hypothetical protein